MMFPPPRRIFLLAALSPAASATSITGEASGQAAIAGVLQIPLRPPLIESSPDGVTTSKRHVQIAVEPDMFRRQYNVLFSFGSPSQAISLPLDTTSDILWARERPKSPSRPIGFDRSKSVTLKPLGKSRTLKYPQNNCSEIQVESHRDTVSIGPVRINNLVFGTARGHEEVLGDAFTGIFGIGMSMEPGKAPDEFSNSLMNALKKQRSIQGRTFSLNIGGLGKDEGLILIGGIDTKKFSGRLGKQHMVEGHYSGTCIAKGTSACERGYVIPVNRISTSVWGDTSNVLNAPGGVPMLLDSASTINFFPPDIIGKILPAFPGARATRDIPLYEVDCSLRLIAGSIDFTFGTTTIRVPYREFVWEPPSLPNRCFLAVKDHSEVGCSVLGQPFLRAAYVVVDQDGRDIYLANVANCGSNVVAVQGASSIASQVGSCGPTVKSIKPAKGGRKPAGRASPKQQ